VETGSRQENASSRESRAPFRFNRNGKGSGELTGNLFNRGVSGMALTQGNYRDYDFDRMVVRFTMKNDLAEIACAISTDAMDQMEGSSRTPPGQREQQFLRLRERIEARAARKFSDVELEGNPPGVILRAIDFRSPPK